MHIYGPKEIVAISEEGGVYIAPFAVVRGGLIGRAPVEYLSPEKLAQLSTTEPEYKVGSVLR